MENKLDDLITYACEKFEKKIYDEALEAFVLAYSKGHKREWILETIYQCYMNVNDVTFRTNYERLQTENSPVYEECILDFVPYREGEYYIFDKEQLEFKGIFAINEIIQAEVYNALKESEYSAAVLVIDWDWRVHKNALTDALQRKLYAVCSDLNRMCSYWKIPELTEYMKNVMLFSDWNSLQEYFHKNTAIYLPKIYLGEQEYGEIFYKIFQEEHEYRLTPAGRNPENVFWTIGIPTRNRGHLVLKRLEHLLKMPYDAEIEIVISKNGTLLYEEEYEQISQLEDARIQYYDHGKDLKVYENWHYVMEMARGKYVLMVSDEDDVVLEGLEHYFKLVNLYPELTLIRPKSFSFFRDIDVRKYCKKGVDALEDSFLRQNYLSGIIFKKESFLQENLRELEQFADNIFYQYYPHEWWCGILNLKGDYVEEPVQLISEGKSILNEEVQLLDELGESNEKEGFTEDMLPKYATYSERFKQFQGQVEFLHFLMKKNEQVIEKGLLKAMNKLSFLLEMAYRLQYNVEEFPAVAEMYVWICMEAMDEFPLAEESKVSILYWIRTWGVELKELLNN